MGCGIIGCTTVIDGTQLETDGVNRNVCIYAVKDLCGMRVVVSGGKRQKQMYKIPDWKLSRGVELHKMIIEIMRQVLGKNYFY